MTDVPSCVAPAVGGTFQSAGWPGLEGTPETPVAFDVARRPRTNGKPRQVRCEALPSREFCREPLLGI
jgi:hypothetical protein